MVTFFYISNYIRGPPDTTHKLPATPSRAELHTEGKADTGADVVILIRPVGVVHQLVEWSPTKPDVRGLNPINLMIIVLPIQM